MTVIFSDNFNRADSDTVDATNWTEVTDVDILSNQVRGVIASGGAWPIIYTTTSAHAAIADVKVTVTQVESTGDGGPCARVTESDATPTMYSLDAFSNTLETLRYNNSATATVLQSSSITSVANGVVALQVTGSGATVTLKAYYQGVQVGADISDSSASRITAAGQTGIQIFATGADGDYDDFSVDDLVSSATVDGPLIGGLHFSRIRRF